MAAAEATGFAASPRIGPGRPRRARRRRRPGRSGRRLPPQAGGPLLRDPGGREGSPAARGRATTRASSSFRPRATRDFRACRSRAPPTATRPATRSWATCAATPRPSGFRSRPEARPARRAGRRGVPAADRADGGEHRARTLIAATGSFARPHRPRFPGQGAFRGRILHAAEYRNPGPFRGKRVVVVGAGNSAVQIAHELAEVAETTLATRAPIRFMPQILLGRRRPLLALRLRPRPPPARAPLRRLRARGRRGRRDLRRRGALRKTRPAAGVLPLHRKRRGLGRRARGAGGRRPPRHRLRPEPGLPGTLGRPAERRPPGPARGGEPRGPRALLRRAALPDLLRLGDPARGRPRRRARRRPRAPPGGP